MKSVLVAIALLTSGCSVVLVNKPPSKVTPGQYPDCHESSAAPLGDGLLAGLIGLSAAASDGDASERIVAGAIAGIYALSAGLGFRWSSRCTTLRSEWKEGHSDRALVPGPAPVKEVRPERLPEGTAAGVCYPNLTCNRGLYCDPTIKRCRRGDRGLAGGLCFDDGTCHYDCSCVEGRCVVPRPLECETDEHCLDGHACQAGYCVPFAELEAGWIEGPAPGPAPDQD